MVISAEQRRTGIIERVREAGKVRISDLSRQYGVSEVSIRKDLELLEKQGYLNRIHGGAVSVNKSYINMDLDERFTTNSASKIELARAVASLVTDNDTIMLNAGTTLLYVLRAIQSKKNISIVTNSIQNAIEAISYESFNVILLGGQIDKKYQFTYGTDTLNQLDQYHATKCILSLDGINSTTGLSLYYASETDVINKMITSAGEVIVAADNSKLGKNTFTRVAPLSCVDKIVTNKNGNSSELEKIRKMGIEVIEA